MEHAEQLADYLAGALSDHERVALEAALARDPALRDALEALRRADAAMAAIPAPQPPEGFRRRVRATVDEELARAIRPSPAAHRSRSRRQVRGSGGWLPALAGAAAGVVALAGIAIGIGQLRGPADDFMAADAPELHTAEAETDAAAPFAPDGEPAPDAGITRAPDVGIAESASVVVDDGRELDDATLEQLLQRPEVTAVIERQLTLDDAAAEGDRWREAAAQDTVVGCLDALEAEHGPVVPILAEIGTRDGIPVIAFVLVGTASGDDVFAAPVVIVTDHASCTTSAIVTP